MRPPVVRRFASRIPCRRRLAIFAAALLVVGDFHADSSAVHGSASEPAIDSKSPIPVSVEDKLRRATMSLVVDRDSPSRVFKHVAEEQGIALEIVGADLQLEGITQGTAIRVNLPELTRLELVLQEIVKNANPGNPSRKLDAPEQKLVYVLSPDKQKIIITTRAKAWERGTPPDVFKIAKPKVATAKIEPPR